MPYVSEHAVRLESPSKYARFRRENDKFGKGIDVIWGITEEGKAEIQALRFDAERFTVEQVREWLKEHGFEPLAIEPARKKFSDDEGSEVEREALLLRAGEYPDKGITITEADLDRLAEQGTGAPVIVEHKPTLLLGWVRELWRKGKELWGKLALKPHANALIDESPVRSLSVGLRLEEGEPRLEEVSLTATPRIADAQLFHEAQHENPDTTLYIAQQPNLGVQEGSMEKVAQQPHEVVEHAPNEAQPPSELEQELARERARANALEQRVDELTRQVQFAQTLLVQQACASLVEQWRRKGKLTPAAAKHAETLLLTLAQAEPRAIVQFSQSHDTRTLPEPVSQLVQLIDALPEQPVKRAAQFVSLDEADREQRKRELANLLRAKGFSIQPDTEIPDFVLDAAARIDGLGGEPL